MRAKVLWLGVGGGVAVAIATALFLEKRAKAAPLLPVQTYGEPVRVSLTVPSGWRRATNAEVMALPELRSQANALVNTSGFTSMQYGSLSPFVASDGKTYATWIEQHWHEPGGAARPWGLHHGVTLLARA